MIADLPFKSRDIISAIQEENFARTMDLCFERHPYYRERFKSMGLSRGDICSLADIDLIPLISKKDNDGNYDYFIEITTRQALVKEITIDGNGFWKCSSNEIPKEIPSRTTTKIRIRKISKEGKNEPCTIRLEVDGYQRWILDIVFPGT